MDKPEPKTPPRRRWRRQWTADNTLGESVSSLEFLSPSTSPSPSPSNSSPVGWSMIVLEVKVPGVGHRIPIEMSMTDTVLKLKEEILAQKSMRTLSMERICLQTHVTCVELLDGQILRDCPVLDCDYPDNEIDVFLKPPPRTEAACPESGKLNVWVLPMNSKEKIEIEVNAEDKVGVLREKIEEIQRKSNRFRLPSGDNYYFMLLNTTLDELMSFQWNKVQNGDTIDIFGCFDDDDEYTTKDDFSDEEDDPLSMIDIPDLNLNPNPMKGIVIYDMYNQMYALESKITVKGPRNSGFSSTEGCVRVKSAGVISRSECRAACGGVLVDCSDAFQAGYCKSLEECSILRAELCGIYHGVRLALAKGFYHIEVVSASAEAIELLSNECMEGHDEYELVDLIISLLDERALTASWSHFSGEHSNNQLEYCFAQLGLSLVYEARIFDVVLPEFVADMHTEDVAPTTKPVCRKLFS